LGVALEALSPEGDAVGNADNVGAFAKAAVEEGNGLGRIGVFGADVFDKDAVDV
jgi:hypothetical protein